MKKEFQIKEPCPVAREDMRKVSGGSFCDLCSKKVYDLADKTDEEIKTLLKSNSSVCGRIQTDRLFIPKEKPETQYNFFQFPFRKIAGGIFLSILFTSNLNAQKMKIDTLEAVEIQGMVWIAPKSEDDDYDIPQPVINRTLEIKISGDPGNLIQYQSITLLTPFKRFSSGNYIHVPADLIKMSNVFVIEGVDPKNGELNANKYFLFVNKRHIKDNNILNLNLDQAKRVLFNPKNKEFIYFLDGEEITKREFEHYQKENKIESYFLPEIYAEELFGDDYYLENGAVVSYRK
ncbi:hypothetical protein [Chryseobacterium sp. BIGb0232]|uniref:hypothetical protein n=1 Tax=Chryseobacterium sp. BIGb0232 TaxID=2940598 RepID=UPI0011CDFF63|nr:hypothetical protein [Chryseobacterium sp. BIGb0232]MCS4303813.1 hypothetical protein [Chryseobacterium sp. BIGb0232]